jgi:2-polyprenyl-3-methyl-5-hydroxy-6-metoxy-1,4-benzoquinol methylase
MIVFGEYIFQMVPIGTHYYEKFVALDDSLQMLKESEKKK